MHAREARAVRPQAREQGEEEDEFSLSAVKAKVLAKIIQEMLSNWHLKVVAVNVEGLARTKDDVVMDSVKDLFKVDK